MTHRGFGAMERKSLIFGVSCRPGVSEDKGPDGLAREGNLPYWVLGTSFAAILAILGVALLPYWLYGLAWVPLGRYIGAPGG